METIRTVTIPLNEYENLKEEINELIKFKRGSLILREEYSQYSHRKYYTLTEIESLDELNRMMKEYEKQNSKLISERLELTKELKKIKKSLFYKLFLKPKQ